MNAINALLRALKYPPLPEDLFDPVPSNVLRDAIRTWPRSEIPQKVLLRIVEETYQRAVGPNVAELRHYEAFSSEVYGELLPSFVTEIIKATGLNSNHLFLDLGSGVGNVVLQASLATGCRSYGIELMPGPAKLARKQLEQFQIRCKMWGVSMGGVELEEGDMLTSPRTDELIRKADVILVNNKVFLEPCELLLLSLSRVNRAHELKVNDGLRLKFLDLKDSAIVISLNPFKPPTRKINERNVSLINVCSVALV